MGPARKPAVELPRGAMGAPGSARPSTALEGQTKRRLDRGRQRLQLLTGVFAIAFSVLAARLVELTIFADTVERSARAAASAPLDLRAEIEDRNGQLVATNLKVASLYADPHEIWRVDEAVEGLARVFPELNRAELTRRLSSDKRFVWIKRDLTPKQQREVHGLGFPGLHFKSEERRFYLQGRMLVHVLGAVDTDNHGVAGLEKALDRQLMAGSATPLRLSLDLSVQHALRDELAGAMTAFSAKGAAGLIMDAANGEILAMVSLPDYDPNDPSSVVPDQRFNRATLGVYEMGSTFKAFTTAMALDSAKVNLRTGYDATKPIRIGGHVISDYHAENRWLTVEEIFLRSSNIGSARMALTVGVDAHRAFLAKLGLMERPTIEVAEVGAPLVPARWHDVNSMTIAFGHGMAVSPLQLVKAAAPLVNGGYLVEPTLLKRPLEEAVARVRVIKPETSRTMVRLLREVVEKGTGRQADVPGYSVGGKTGTAEKATQHGYNRKALLSSFLATFPTQAPRYLVLVMLDEPQGTADTQGFATAGWTAAPTTGRVIARVGPLLRMNPVWDAEKTVVAANEGSDGRHASR